MDVIDSSKANNVFWEKKMTIPGTRWEIKGFSIAAYRTAFYIPTLNIALDAGSQFNKRPDHVFVTHTHLDHILSLPMSMMGLRGLKHTHNIYAADSAIKGLEGFVKVSFATNSMCDRDYSERWKFHGLIKGEKIPIKMSHDSMVVEVFECDHGIPTISYGFSNVKDKLKKEYLEDKSSLKKLRENGVQITEKIEFKKFTFICDTSIKVFDMNPTILDYPVIFIECTFVLDEELENAHKTKHIHWSQLKPYVENNPQITFILFHFSKRYTENQLDSFFKAENMKNLRWW